MRHYALIGHKLTHSYSKRLFASRHFPDAAYSLCPMPSLEGLREWVRRERIDGFNVTNPYKQAILPLLDGLSPEARAIGAVNCVCVANGRLTGHNTDAPAFRQTLSDQLNTKYLTLNAAYILGTGGAAHAVAFALSQMGLPHTFVSRHPDRHPNAIGYPQLIAEHLPLNTLLVNATPVGTWPDVDASPLPPGAIPSTSGALLVYDLVYNPTPTCLMLQAAAAGAAVCDGMTMLRRQAELSWQLWGLEMK